MKSFVSLLERRGVSALLGSRFPRAGSELPLAHQARRLRTLGGFGANLQGEMDRTLRVLGDLRWNLSEKGERFLVRWPPPAAGSRVRRIYRQGLNSPVLQGEARPEWLVRSRAIAEICLRDHRAVHAGGKSKLVKKLEDEIKEESSYKPDEIVAAGPPKGWAVDQADGDCHIILSSEGQGGESIEISVLASDDNIEEVPLPDQVGALGADRDRTAGAKPRQTPRLLSRQEEAEGEGEEDMEPLFEVPFTVNLIKPESQDGLMFDCVTDGETFQIRRVLLERYGDLERMMEEGAEEGEEEGAEDTDYPMEPYRGPVFDNLDPELQDQFYEYLEDRGVNEVLAQ